MRRKGGTSTWARRKKEGTRKKKKPLLTKRRKKERSVNDTFQERERSIAQRGKRNRQEWGKQIEGENGKVL